MNESPLDGWFGCFYDTLNLSDHFPVLLAIADIAHRLLLVLPL